MLAELLCKVGGVQYIACSVKVFVVVSDQFDVVLSSQISSYSDINHMTSGTLATSCGPSIFPYLPPSNANAIVKFLIDHCNEIFID